MESRGIHSEFSSVNELFLDARQHFGVKIRTVRASQRRILYKHDLGALVRA